MRCKPISGRRDKKIDGTHIGSHLIEIEGSINLVALY